MSSVTPGKLVQIAKAQPDEHGRLAYRRLVDDGGPVLRFASGYGFIERDVVFRRSWKIEPLDDGPGWECRQGWVSR